jgi:hypothetical protein
MVKWGTRDQPTEGTVNKTSTWIVGLMGAVLVLAGSASAQNASPAVAAPTHLMKANAELMGRILSDLVAARYNRVPADAEILMQHAVQLAEAPPADLQNAAERAAFLAYATNLKLAAWQLTTATTELLRRERRQGSASDLNVDYLRSAAAEHFGNVVTTCAQCHSRFKPGVL